MFDPKLVGTELDKANRERIKKFYIKFSYLDFLPPDYIFNIFPNMTHFSLQWDIPDYFTDDYPRRIAAILIQANIRKIKNLILDNLGTDNFFTALRYPLDSVENLEIRRLGQGTIDLAEVARVFPKAKSVVVYDSGVTMNTKNLANLQKNGVKVAWEKLFLGECSPILSSIKNISFINPVFIKPNFKVTTFSCKGGLTIEQAPTMDDIIQSLAHRLHYDQQTSKCQR